MWFWGQAILAIPTTLIMETRRHTLLTIRAVATALVLVTMLSVTSGSLQPWIVAAAEVYLPEHEPYIAATYTIVNGERVAGEQQVPLAWATFVYVPVARLVMFALGACLIGWLIRRPTAPLLPHQSWPRA